MKERKYSTKYIYTLEYKKHINGPDNIDFYHNGRIAIGNINSRLPEGGCRKLNPNEVKYLKGTK